LDFSAFVCITNRNMHFGGGNFPGERGAPLLPEIHKKSTLMKMHAFNR
jgi:hypothetical protein